MTAEITDAELVTVAEPAVRMAAEQSGLPFDLTDAHDYIDSLLTLCLALFVESLDRATDPRDKSAVDVHGQGAYARCAYLMAKFHVVNKKRVTLKLSVAEVDVLTTILMHVGGPPQYHRGIASAILDSILDSGEDFDGACADVSGSIYLDASPNGPRGSHGEA